MSIKKDEKGIKSLERGILFLESSKRKLCKFQYEQSYGL